MTSEWAEVNDGGPTRALVECRSLPAHRQVVLSPHGGLCMTISRGQTDGQAEARSAAAQCEYRCVMDEHHDYQQQDEDEQRHVTVT